MSKVSPWSTTSKSPSGHVVPGSLAGRYSPLAPKVQQKWKRNRLPRANQACSQPPKPAKPEPPLTRESTPLDHVFEAR